MSGAAGDVDLDATVAEGTDEPEGIEAEEQMAEEALAGEGGEEEQQSAGPAAAAQQQMLGLPPDFQTSLAQAFQQAVQPLVPKPPIEKRWWDDPAQMKERMLANPEKFHSGMGEYLKHHLGEAVRPLQDTINKQNEIISYLYARGAERPDFGQISQRADEIARGYQVPYRTALRMATDEASKVGARAPTAKGKPVRTPPRHLSSPDTRQGTGGKVAKGRSTDFGDIMKEVVAEAEGGA